MSEFAPVPNPFDPALVDEAEVERVRSDVFFYHERARDDTRAGAQLHPHVSRDACPGEKGGCVARLGMARRGNSGQPGDGEAYARRL